MSAANSTAPVNTASADVEIEISRNSVPSQTGTETAIAIVQPRMTREEDEPKLKGGIGFSFVEGLPLKTDNNFCRLRCCCMDKGCTELKAEVQWLCLKLESGGNCRIEQGIPCKSHKNFCRFMCFCVDG